MNSDTLPKPPTRLWLQRSGMAVSRTWTDEPIFDRDIEYVRPDYQINRSTLDSLRQRIEGVLDHARLDEGEYNDLMHALALLPEAD